MHRLAVALILTLTTSILGFAHYGAKYEPPDGKIYHGSGWNYNGSQQTYENMFPGDKRPLVLQVNVSLPGTRGTSTARIVQSLTQPVVHADSQFVEFSMHWQGRDATVMLDSVYLFTDQWDQYVDMLDSAFGQVQRPFFFRIGFEFNGNWNPYHPWIFPKAFRKLVLELRRRGHNHFATVWCYEPDADASFADSNATGWKWYPGDDVVDWFGLDLFQVEHFDPALPDSGRGGLTKKGKSEAFLRFAEARGKPVYLNEFSAIHIEATPDSLDQDGADGRADWEAFFTPFFRFVGNHPGIKGWNYIDVDWNVVGHYGEDGWRDARLEINRVLRENWVAEMTGERYLHAGYDIAQEQSVHGDESAVSPPRLTALFSAYPNPFNSTLKISFSTGGQASLPVRLAIYDISGREVFSAVTAPSVTGIRGSTGVSAGRGFHPAAEGGATEHKVTWDASSSPAGVYFVRLQSGADVVTQKVVQMR